MASTETTTVRVRRSTHERLQREAELAGTSVTQVLERAADLLEERRLLDSFALTYERHGKQIHEDMKDWLKLPDETPGR